MATLEQFQATLSALLDTQNESNRQTLREQADIHSRQLQQIQLQQAAQVDALHQQFTQAQLVSQQSVLDGLKSLEEKRAGATLLKLSPLIDIKTIQSMSKFSGKDEDWQSWKFSTLGIFAILGMKDEIELCSELEDKDLFLNVIDEKLKLISEALWHLLTVVLQGRSVVVMRQVAEKSRTASLRGKLSCESMSQSRQGDLIKCSRPCSVPIIGLDLHSRLTCEIGR